MTILSTYLGGIDTTDGSILYAEDLIDSLEAAYPKIQQIVTGSDFDSIATGSNQTNEGSLELTAVSAAQAANKKYVKISITGRSFISAAAGQSNSTNLKAQIKETGGAYGDIIAYQIHTQFQGGSSYVSSTYQILATLTAGQIANGFQVKVFSKSITGADAGNQALFDNIMTIEELI